MSAAHNGGNVKPMTAEAATDLFGDPVRAPIKGTVPAGYVRPPGTGPVGET